MHNTYVYSENFPPNACNFSKYDNCAVKFNSDIPQSIRASDRPQAWGTYTCLPHSLLTKKSAISLSQSDVEWAVPVEQKRPQCVTVDPETFVSQHKAKNWFRWEGVQFDTKPFCDSFHLCYFQKNLFHQCRVALCKKAVWQNANTGTRKAFQNADRARHCESTFTYRTEKDGRMSFSQQDLSKWNVLAIWKCAAFSNADRFTHKPCCRCTCAACNISSRSKHRTGPTGQCVADPLQKYFSWKTPAGTNVWEYEALVWNITPNQTSHCCSNVFGGVRHRPTTKSNYSPRQFVGWIFFLPQNVDWISSWC